MGPQSEVQEREKRPHAAEPRAHAYPGYERRPPARGAAPEPSAPSPGPASGPEEAADWSVRPWLGEEIG